MKQKADFSHVLVEHAEIHRRLENWAQWCRPKLKINVSPMFRLLRPDNFDREYGKTDQLVDIADACGARWFCFAWRRSDFAMANTECGERGTARGAYARKAETKFPVVKAAKEHVGNPFAGLFTRMIA